MRRIYLLTTSLAIIFIAFNYQATAQVYIELDPSSLTPDADGWYRSGDDVEKDGVTQHYEGCEREYGDKHHFEADTQQNFIYQNCMVMPDCWPIDAEDDNSLSNVSQGYIQLGKTKYTASAGSEKDSSQYCYVMSPEVSNIDSIYLEISPDVTVLSSRKVSLDVEYSTDGGDTWSYDNDEVILTVEASSGSKVGSVQHLNSQMEGEDGLYFEDFMTASQSNPVQIRFLSTDYSYQTQGSQRIKIHNIKIYYSETSAIGTTTVQTNAILVSDRNITAKDGSNVVVYNYMGQTIGEGSSVTVKPGVYIVRTEAGLTQKVLVQ